MVARANPSEDHSIRTRIETRPGYMSDRERQPQKIIPLEQGLKRLGGIRWERKKDLRRSFH